MDFKCSVITHGRLNELIQGCSNLKTFQLVYADILVSALSKYDFEDVSSAFLSHEECLESLTMDFGWNYLATEILEDDEIRGVMSMSLFECFRHNDLPAWGFLRGDLKDGSQSPRSETISKMLPHSLQCLVVQSCNKNTVLPLWGLLDSLDSLPNLKEMAFSSELGPTGEPGVHVKGSERFQNSCKESGIEVNSDR